MSRIALRNATRADAGRLLADGLAGGGMSTDAWAMLYATALAEVAAGHRLVMVADTRERLVGYAQLVFAYPKGQEDPEVANGTDTALIDTLRTRPDAPGTLAEHMLHEFVSIAKRRHVRTLTYLLSMENNHALNQAKAWGFEEFRITPQGARLYAFFRKRI